MQCDAIFLLLPYFIYTYYDIIPFISHIKANISFYKRRFAVAGSALISDGDTN